MELSRVHRLTRPAACAGSQFLEPDGNFPNHQPNPEAKEAMEACTDAVNRWAVGGSVLVWGPACCLRP